MRRAIGIAGAFLLLAGAVAHAESALRVPYPHPLGTFRATVYTLDGEAIGESQVDHLSREGGGVLLRSTTRVRGHLQQRLETYLEPVAGQVGLRPVWQRIDRSTGVGDERIVLHIDHRKHRAECRRPGEPLEWVPLPDEDEIANVPMTLLLRPLAAGAVQTVEFQMVVCQRWSRIVGVRARATGARIEGAAELIYRFDIGPVLSTLFQPFLPKIRIWMNPDPPNLWIGHRLPLHPGGPTVLLIRNGVNPTAFLAAR